MSSQKYENSILFWQNIDIDQIVLEHYERGGTPNSTPSFPSKSLAHTPFRSRVDPPSHLWPEIPEASKKESLCCHGLKVFAN